jgi:hypothetical protein
MKLKLGIVLFLFVLIISACNKEQLIKPNEEALCENMLYFDSYEEMNTELEKVMKMSYEERLAWEKSKGFKSIEIEAERLYESIDPEQFKSVDEVKRFVEQHSALLELVEDEKGEYELDTKLSNLPYRYFANKNGFFQVSNHICKAFPEGVLSVEERHVGLISNSDFYTCLSNQYVSVVFQRIDGFKGLNSTCNGGTFRADNGNERIRLIVDAGYYTLSGTNISQVFTIWEARPYNRVLGVWYHAIRTTSCSIDINIKYRNSSGTWRTWNTSYSNSGERTYVLNELKWIDYIYPGSNVEITSYDCWGKQPNTSYAIGKCPN